MGRRIHEGHEEHQRVVGEGAGEASAALRVTRERLARGERLPPNWPSRVA